MSESEQILDPAVVNSAIKASINLANRWDLSDDQFNTLVNAHIGTDYEAWISRDTVQLADDSLIRMSHLLNIHAALRTLFSGDSAYSWLKKPNSNPLFGGKSALSIMLSGGLSELEKVDQYLQLQVH